MYDEFTSVPLDAVIPPPAVMKPAKLAAPLLTNARPLGIVNPAFAVPAPLSVVALDVPFTPIAENHLQKMRGSR